MKYLLHYGTAWTVEWTEKNDRAYVTNARSAQTTEVWLAGDDPDRTVCNCLAGYNRIPPYLRRIIDRRLQTAARGEFWNRSSGT